VPRPAQSFRDIVGRKIFLMRGALQPDGLGEFLQWSHQTGTLETAGGVTIALADAGQPLFSPFHPMLRSPTRVWHH